MPRRATNTGVKKPYSSAKSADIYLAVGSSLVVEPAASLPRLAKQQGARLVIINRDSTPWDAIADIVINSSIGQAMRGIDQHLTGSVP